MDKIVTVKNKKDEAFLRHTTVPFSFSEFTKKQIAELIADMRRVMKEAQGIGLSANQIGHNFRMFVAQVPGEDGAPKFYAVFNPEIDVYSHEMITAEEGCLSVPGLYGGVPRAAKIVLKGFDKNEKPLKIKARFLLARVFQHEVDHLNGKLFIDKADKLYLVSSIK
ncbi:MAG: peptide deformylase [bacterium]|nr:peptide deformylase [bacterium]